VKSEHDPRGWAAARLAEERARLRPDHIDASDLSQYAALQADGGQEAAARAFPSVAAHLDTGCQACQVDVRELMAFTADEAHAQEGIAAHSVVAPGRKWTAAAAAHVEWARRRIVVRLPEMAQASAFLVRQHWQTMLQVQQGLSPVRDDQAPPAATHVVQNDESDTVDLATSRLWTATDVDTGLALRVAAWASADGQYTVETELLASEQQPYPYPGAWTLSATVAGAPVGTRATDNKRYLERRLTVAELDSLELTYRFDVAGNAS
jgi:hypothetical protein